MPDVQKPVIADVPHLDRNVYAWVYIPVRSDTAVMSSGTAAADELHEGQRHAVHALQGHEMPDRDAFPLQRYSCVLGRCGQYFSITIIVFIKEVSQYRLSFLRRDVPLRHIRSPAGRNEVKS